MRAPRGPRRPYSYNHHHNRNHHINAIKRAPQSHHIIITSNRSANYKWKAIAMRKAAASVATLGYALTLANHKEAQKLPGVGKGTVAIVSFWGRHWLGGRVVLVTLRVLCAFRGGPPGPWGQEVDLADPQPQGPGQLRGRAQRPKRGQQALIITEQNL